MKGDPSPDEQIRRFLAELHRKATPAQIGELLATVSGLVNQLGQDDVIRLRKAFGLGAESCPQILDVIDGNLAVRELRK